MNNIKRIVQDNNINEKRERMLNNREIICHLKKEMSDLALFKNVSQYVYNLNLMEYLIRNNNSNKLEILINENKLLLLDVYVLMYENLRKNVECLEQENSYYYQSINIDLRYSFNLDDVPNIFVLESNNDSQNLYRNIIMPEFTTSDEIVGDTVILPYVEKYSTAYLRHFYNRISFKYLEQLSKDYSYSLDSKNLGRVRILNK